MCPIDVYYEPTPPAEGAIGTNDGSTHWGTIQPGDHAMQLRCARQGQVVIACNHEDDGGAIFSRTAPGTDGISVFRMARDGTPTEIVGGNELRHLRDVPSNGEARFETFTPIGGSYSFRAVHNKR